jgi:hypothetical protein
MHISIITRPIKLQKAEITAELKRNLNSVVQKNESCGYTYTIHKRHPAWRDSKLVLLRATRESRSSQESKFTIANCWANSKSQEHPANRRSEASSRKAPPKRDSQLQAANSFPSPSHFSIHPKMKKIRIPVQTLTMLQQLCTFPFASRLPLFLASLASFGTIAISWNPSQTLTVPE